MSVDEGWLKILNPDNNLQHSLDLGGSPWKVEMERAMGIEPTAQAWEAWVLPLYDAREGWHCNRLSAGLVAACGLMCVVACLEPVAAMCH